jgi:hypothetical protein
VTARRDLHAWCQYRKQALRWQYRLYLESFDCRWVEERSGPRSLSLSLDLMTPPTLEHEKKDLTLLSIGEGAVGLDYQQRPPPRARSAA